MFTFRPKKNLPETNSEFTPGNGWFGIRGSFPFGALPPHLKVHSRTCKWLITMVIVSPLRIGLFPFQMALFWLINGGDPNYLLSGMILLTQIPPFFSPPTSDFRLRDSGRVEVFGETFEPYLGTVGFTGGLTHQLQQEVYLEIPRTLRKTGCFFYIQRWLFGIDSYISYRNSADVTWLLPTWLFIVLLPWMSKKCTFWSFDDS